MSKLEWDMVGERIYEAGLDRGVFYPAIDNGIPWNGLISVTESPSGGEAVPYYIDGVKYLNETAPEDLSVTLTAFTYPDEFSECDGTAFDENGLGYTMQPRQPFNLSYRTKVGNDLNSIEHAYKIHLIYNALAMPTQRSNQTLDDSVDPLDFSWSISTTPIPIPMRKPTAHLIIDSRRIDKYHLAEIEQFLYGSENKNPRFPYPEDLIEILGWELFRIIPDETSGMTNLVNDGDPDLKDDDIPNDGLYSQAVGTRLVQSAYTGLYTREES